MAKKKEKENKFRLDKWLWAARLYKPRTLVKTAIESGKVHCRGERCKPSKELCLGDELRIRVGREERTVVVSALSVVRRGAPEAQLLYTETELSIAKRENAAAMYKSGAMGIVSDGKPTKKKRRQLHRFHDACDL